jgi:hypothetical protein
LGENLIRSALGMVPDGFANVRNAEQVTVLFVNKVQGVLSRAVLSQSMQMARRFASDAYVAPASSELVPATGDPTIIAVLLNPKNPDAASNGET